MGIGVRGEGVDLLKTLYMPVKHSVNLKMRKKKRFPFREHIRKKKNAKEINGRLIHLVLYWPHIVPRVLLGPWLYILQRLLMQIMSSYPVPQTCVI